MIYEDLERDFIKRTLHIVNDYKGEYEVTLLINCLLGLLVLPKERLFDMIEEKPLSELSEDWGVTTSSISSRTCNSLKNLIRHMRNSTAHFDIEFGTEKESIKSVIFKRQKNTTSTL